MKKAYYEHMIFVPIVVFVGIGVPLFLWGFLNSGPVEEVKLKIHNVYPDPNAFTPPDTRPTRRNVNLASADGKTFHGQFGVRVRIIPDNPPAIIVTKPKPAKVFAKAEIATVVDSNISLSNVTDGEAGPYIPSDAQYTFDTPPVETTVVEHNVVPCSVLVAVEPEYPFVALERGKEGVANIIICVDETGRVSLFPDEVVKKYQAERTPIEKLTTKVGGKKFVYNYVVSKEEPTDYFFAKKVAEALAQWAFSPSTVDGTPVKTLFPIGHSFCLTDDCKSTFAGLHYNTFAPK